MLPFDWSGNLDSRITATNWAGKTAPCGLWPPIPKPLRKASLSFLLINAGYLSLP